MHRGFITALVLAHALLPCYAPSGAAQSAGPTIDGCPVFPSDNIWNTPVDTLPVDPHSAQYVASIGADSGFKPDFGAGLYEGAPIGVLTSSCP